MSHWVCFQSYKNITKNTVRKNFILIVKFFRFNRHCPILNIWPQFFIVAPKYLEKWKISFCVGRIFYCISILGSFISIKTYLQNFRRICVVWQIIWSPYSVCFLQNIYALPSFTKTGFHSKIEYIFIPGWPRFKPR